MFFISLKNWNKVTKPSAYEEMVFFEHFLFNVKYTLKYSASCFVNKVCFIPAPPERALCWIPPSYPGYPGCFRLSCGDSVRSRKDFHAPYMWKVPESRCTYPGHCYLTGGKQPLQSYGGDNAGRYFWHVSGGLVSLCRYTGYISEMHSLSMNMKQDFQFRKEKSSFLFEEFRLLNISLYSPPALCQFTAFPGNKWSAHQEKQALL